MPKAGNPYLRTAAKWAMANAPALAFRAGQNVGKKIFTKKSGGGVTRYTGVTQQHDRAKVYKKKYMRKGKKKAWKKFVKKVQAVNNKDRGMVTALYNNVFTPAAASGSAQLIFEMHLYGFKSGASATVAGCNDLASLVTSDSELVYDNVKIPGSGIVTRSPTGAVDKFQFESAILDATISNDNDTTVEVDIYAIRYNKFTKGNFSSMQAAFAQATAAYEDYVQTAVGLTPQTIISISDRGATPFECGKAISMSGIRILGKEKYLISAGQAITIQLRDPKNRYFNATDFYDSSTSFKYRDWTQSYLIIGKKVVENASPMTLRVGCTRSYKYTYEGLKANKSYKLTL